MKNTKYELLQPYLDHKPGEFVTRNYVPTGEYGITMVWLVPVTTLVWCFESNKEHILTEEQLKDTSLFREIVEEVELLSFIPSGKSVRRNQFETRKRIKDRQNSPFTLNANQLKAYWKALETFNNPKVPDKVKQEKAKLIEDYKTKYHFIQFLHTLPFWYCLETYRKENTELEFASDEWFEFVYNETYTIQELVEILTSDMWKYYYDYIIATEPSTLVIERLKQEGKFTTENYLRAVLDVEAIEALKPKEVVDLTDWKPIEGSIENAEPINFDLL